MPAILIEVDLVQLPFELLVGRARPGIKKARCGVAHQLPESFEEHVEIVDPSHRRRPPGVRDAASAPPARTGARNHLPANCGLLNFRFERETSRADICRPAAYEHGGHTEHFLCSILRTILRQLRTLGRSGLPTSANQFSIGCRPQLPRFRIFSQKRMASATHPSALVPVPSPKPWPRFPNL